VGDSGAFAVLVLISAVVGLLAVLSNRLSERIHVPAPALFLVAAAVAIRLFPDLHSPPEQLVERVVTVALRCCASCSTAACTWAGHGSDGPRPRSP